MRHPGVLAAKMLGRQERLNGAEEMKNKLPQGYRARPARMNDLEGAVRTFNACARQLIGVEKYHLEDYRREWQEPGFNLETDSRVVIASNGEVVAYYEAWDVDEPHVIVYCWGQVHPAHSGKGIGSYLLEWAEQQARQAIPKAPAAARVIMRCFVASLNEPAQELFRNAGLGLVRHSLRMVIDLNGRPPQPRWPEGIAVRSLEPRQDERAVLQVVRESFKDHWGYVERPFEDDYQRWAHIFINRPDFDPSLWFLAVDGDRIAGVSLCQPETNDDPEMGWVATLGVCRPWRRRGLGMALLQHSFQEFYQRGVRKVGLGVDAQNLTGATQLYLKAGMHPDASRQYSIYEKELRPGVEWSTQAVEAQSMT